VSRIICGDSLEVLKTLESESVDCCVTSPPYWGLRDYGKEGQLGLEKTPEEYVAKMVEVFRDVKRVMKKEGTLWLNLGDSYNGSGGTGWTGLESKNWKQKSQPRHLKNHIIKPKDLVGIPWLVAFALRADGWYLRQDIIWAKPNPMPESVTDRCTKSHEYIFLMSKSAKYYFDNESIKEKVGESVRSSKSFRSGGSYTCGQSFDNSNIVPNKTHGDGDITLNGRNKRSVWTITTKPFKGSHFATFPEDLIIPMIKAGCPEGGIVLDPFSGAGTTAMVSKKLGRQFIGIELNPDYVKMAESRIETECGTLF